MSGFLKLLAIGGSNSSESINRQFAAWAASQLEGVEVKVLDLNDYEMPLYSPEREAVGGIPPAATSFLSEIAEADGIVISLAEHNGAYTAAFKNLLDWSTRKEKKLWAGKPMLLMSTSPGGRGGASVMDLAAASFPRFGAQVAATFSLPSFGDNFSADQGITDEKLRIAFSAALATFSAQLG